MNNFTNKIICGDNIEIMAKMPDNCIDTIITDPPYGLGFMGKNWDTFKPEVVSQQMKRDTRTQKRRKLYGGRESDAPSAAMAAGRYDFNRNAEFQQWFTVWATEVLRIAKPGAMMLIFGGTRTYHRLTCAIEDAGWQIRDCMIWLYGSGFPKSHNISKAIDKAKGPRKNLAEELQCSTSLSRKSDIVRAHHTAAHYADLVDLWDGYGTALKPAWEPIVVAMKLLDGTFAENAEKWGVAGLNIDGGRIKGTVDPHNYTANRPCKIKGGWGFKGEKGTEQHPQGRFPANLILDEEAAAMLDEQSGVSKSPKTYKRGSDGFSTGNSGIKTIGEKAGKDSLNFGDSGGASRFFYTAKASRAERNAGLAGMEAKPIKGRDEGQDIRNVPYKLGISPVQNHHPTVKPLSLMEYLCRLTKTPTVGVVLDPFGGSGTTAIACVNTGRDYIIIEKDPEYCQIAEKRVKHWKQQKAGQSSLFVEAEK